MGSRTIPDALASERPSPDLAFWFNPAAEATSAELTARREGARIPMDGELWDGTPIRWSYADVSDVSFRYRAERMDRDTERWRGYLGLDGTRVEIP